MLYDDTQFVRQLPQTVEYCANVFPHQVSR